MMKETSPNEFFCFDPMSADMEGDRGTAASCEEGGGLLDLYMHEIGGAELLDAEKERRLGELSCRGTEAERHAAREALVRANLRLVVKIAHDFRGKGLPLDDLVAEGNCGLMRAAEKFQPGKGAKFSSYAALWIRQRMRLAVADQVYQIRIPFETGILMGKIARMEKVLEDKFGRTPSHDELAEKLGMSSRAVAQLRKIRPQYVALDAPVGDDTDNSFGDIIPDLETAQPDRRCFDRDMFRCLRKHFRKLPAKEQQVLRLRFLENKSLTEVSRELGRTHERVRQIQMDALKKLRRYLDDGENAA